MLHYKSFINYVPFYGMISDLFIFNNYDIDIDDDIDVFEFVSDVNWVNGGIFLSKN